MRRLFRLVAYGLCGALGAYLAIVFLWMRWFNPFVPTDPNDIFDGTRYVMLLAFGVAAAIGYATSETH